MKRGYVVGIMAAILRKEEATDEKAIERALKLLKAAELAANRPDTTP